MLLILGWLVLETRSGGAESPEWLVLEAWSGFCLKTGVASALSLECWKPEMLEAWIAGNL